MVCNDVEALVQYGIDKALIAGEDRVWARNQLLAALSLDGFAPEDAAGGLSQAVCRASRKPRFGFCRIGACVCCGRCGPTTVRWKGPSGLEAALGRLERVDFLTGFSTVDLEAVLVLRDQGFRLQAQTLQAFVDILPADRIPIGIGKAGVQAVLVGKVEAFVVDCQVVEDVVLFKGLDDHVRGCAETICHRRSSNICGERNEARNGTMSKSLYENEIQSQ